MSLHENIGKIVTELFKAEERRNQILILQLEKKNTEITGKPTDGFLLQGAFFRPKGRQGRSITPYMTLAPELQSDGVAYLQEVNKTAQEKQLVRQALVNCLSAAFSLQDMRDTLPECVVSMINQLRTLPRTREEGFTLAHDPIKTKQFLEAKAIMELYSVTRLLY